jgi:hypothetical protein
MLPNVNNLFKEEILPKVYNKKTDIIPEGAVYVGRPTKWGNPYKISKSLRREDACRMYRTYVSGREAEIRNDLKGKDLVCWCAPEPCHADVLIEIANV